MVESRRVLLDPFGQLVVHALYIYVQLTALRSCVAHSLLRCGDHALHVPELVLQLALLLSTVGLPALKGLLQHPQALVRSAFRGLSAPQPFLQLPHRLRVLCVVFNLVARRAYLLLLLGDRALQLTLAVLQSSQPCVHLPEVGHHFRRGVLAKATARERWMLRLLIHDRRRRVTGRESLRLLQQVVTKAAQVQVRVFLCAPQLLSRGLLGSVLQRTLLVQLTRRSWREALTWPITCRPKPSNTRTHLKAPCLRWCGTAGHAAVASNPGLLAALQRGTGSTLRRHKRIVHSRLVEPPQRVAHVARTAAWHALRLREQRALQRVHGAERLSPLAPTSSALLSSLRQAHSLTSSTDSARQRGAERDPEVSAVPCGVGAQGF